VNQICSSSVGENPYHKLSPVELELLAFMADGLSNREIARVKGVKIKSCENAISRIAKKLDIRQSPATNQRVLLVRRFLSFQGE
jgi:DNA-binding NarL/FixJ family response regulator